MYPSLGIAGIFQRAWYPPTLSPAEHVNQEPPNDR